ncbi:MAG TPA: response regulator [Rectinemataceae bacterium]|nr:response regulator [Rectinemataceae bacterium]
MARQKILVVDGSELFRSYLRDRLGEYFEVEVAINGLDGLSKLRTFLPDLLIMDQDLQRKSSREILEEKNRNPNTSEIPVLLTSTKIDRSRLLEFVPFRIRKVLMKPLRIDALFSALNEALGTKLRLEETPCIIEAHVNDNIVFIEIAKGLNRERIELLRFKVAELVELYQIRSPRILVMLSDIELSFVDGSNIELLLRILVTHAQGKASHVKILTISSFLREFVGGRQEFRGIEVLSNLQGAMDGLLIDYDPNSDNKEKAAELISERILSAQGQAGGAETIEMRFRTEGDGAKAAEAQATGRPASSGALAASPGQGLVIAVVDDDFVIQELVKTTFGAINASVSAFSDGREFIDNARAKDWDLVFLDLLMPGMDGFEVLKRLRSEENDVPIIILSAVTQREAVVKAMEAGVRSYLVKPLRPDQIMKKTLEILKANF